MSSMRTSEPSPQKQSLWKKIGYVKESHMSEAEYRVGRERSPGSVKGDKRGNVYNSLIQHRLVIPQPPKTSLGSSQDQNESGSAFDNLLHTNQTHIDEAFQNMLKVLHAPEDQLADIENERQMHELNAVFTPNSNSKEQKRFERIDEERDSGYCSSRQPTTFQRLNTLQQEIPSQQFPTENQHQFINKMVPSHDLSIQTPPLVSKYQKLAKKLKISRNLILDEFAELRRVYGQLRAGLQERFLSEKQTLRQLSREFNPAYQDMIGKINEEIAKRVSQERLPSRDTTSLDSTIRASQQQIQMQSIEIQSLKEALQSSEQRQANLQSRFSELQSRYRELETTTNLKLQRTTDENAHLQQEIKQLEEQHGQQRKILKQRLERQRQSEQNHRQNQISNTEKQYLTEKIKQKDIEVQLLREQVAEKCTTIEMLVSRLKEVEADDQRQRDKEMYEAMLAQKDQTIQQLRNKFAQNQAIQQELKNKFYIVQMDNYTLQEDNFHLKQRVQAFDGELADRLREQRKLLTKEHMSRVVLLEDKNARLSDRINTVSQELSRERDTKCNSQRMPIKSNGDTSRPYYNREDERGSIGSNDTHQLINVMENETNQYKAKYGSAIQKQIVVKLASPNRRIEMPSPNASSQYIASPPAVGNLRYEAYSRDNTEYMDMHTSSQEELFYPFYRQLNGTAKPTKSTRPQDNPSKVYERNNMKIQTGELPINPTTNINSARYTFNPSKQIRTVDVQAYDHTQPYMLSKNSSQSQFRSPNPYIPTRDRPFANSRKELHSNREHQPYMHTQKVDLGRLETQIQILTKELRSQLQTVTRRINK